MVLNCDRVGAGSVPLNPPIAITGSPVASSSGAASCEPVVAATHLYPDTPLSSSRVSALLTWVFPASPPPKPPPRPPPKPPPPPNPAGRPAVPACPWPGAPVTVLGTCPGAPAPPNPPPGRPKPPGGPPC